MENEIWKDVIGYAGLYQVSSFGNVKSICFGRGKNPKILKKSKSNNGYNSVNLYLNGVPKTHKVHRLIANAFIPNTENKPQVNHINGLKTDNRVENLEWNTMSENHLHAYKIGLHKNHKTICVIQKKLNGDVIGNYKSIAYASLITGVCRQSIEKCLLGKYKTAGGFKWIRN